PGVERHGRQHAHRERPRPLHPHPGRQHGRTLDRVAAGRVLGSQLMTPTTTTERTAAPEGGPELQPERTSGTGSLSRAARHCVLGLSALVGSLLVILLWGWNLVGAVILSAIVYVVAIYATSRVVEGPRHATDRMVTGIVTTMFLCALIPLVSVVWTVVTSGLARFDVQFFTYSMLDDSTG